VQRGAARGGQLRSSGVAQNADETETGRHPAGACQSSHDDQAGPQIISATARSADAWASTAVANPRFQYSAPNTIAGSATVSAM
jgi:hypothetical protein